MAEAAAGRREWRQPPPGPRQRVPAPVLKPCTTRPLSLRLGALQEVWEGKLLGSFRLGVPVRTISTHLSARIMPRHTDVLPVPELVPATTTTDVGRAPMAAQTPLRC